jgi:putative nucleotidyltransferase with HDIG domain
VHGGLPARFAAAITAQDAGPLQSWLDTIPGLTFGDTPIVDRFDRWAAEPGAFAARTHAETRRVRRQLAMYRLPTPVILRVVDDIDAIVETLFVQLDGASPLMAEHSRAVSAWCSRLARTLGLSESEITFVARCGLIHDIGKMVTPADILNAPRQLSPDEWAIMRDHTVEGERILARLPMLAHFIPIVRGHHERLDGKGYPDGLRANAIPVAARIVSVADSFNAMIGRRPYRLPMVPTQALDELVRHRHTQFDPEIVEAMVQIVLGRFAEPKIASI